MLTSPHNIFTLQRGVTLVELLIALVIAALLFGGLNSVLGGVLRSQEYSEAHASMLRDAEFAMDRMVRMAGGSPRLLLPLPDNPTTNWPENIREQTQPMSPPIGSSFFATAVLAVTVPAYYDLDFDGFPDADDDRDGRIDEDPFGDMTNDYVSGIYLIDDDGDGLFDEDFINWWNDDEDSAADEDPVNGIDDDGDGRIDEDPFSDMNGDGQPGIAGVDEDGDGSIDEGALRDEDEDGQADEDSYNPVVYYLFNGNVIERLPVPWDENTDGNINGRDFVQSIVAENVTRLRFERLPVLSGQPQLVDITLELTTVEAGTVAVSSRVRVGGSL